MSSDFQSIWNKKDNDLLEQLGEPTVLDLVLNGLIVDLVDIHRVSETVYTVHVFTKDSMREEKHVTCAYIYVCIYVAHIHKCIVYVHC